MIKDVYKKRNRFVGTGKFEHTYSKRSNKEMSKR